jgi:hypothetical protein
MRRSVHRQLFPKDFHNSEGNKTMTNEKDLSPTEKDVPTVVEVTTKYLDSLRKAVGLHINPETAEVEWIYAQTLDPYGDYSDLPEEYQQVGREYFARSPGSDVWIDFGDLPQRTRDALWEKHESKLAFPAGLEWTIRLRRETQS